MRASHTAGLPHGFWWRSPELRGEVEAILGVLNDARSQAGVGE